MTLAEALKRIAQIEPHFFSSFYRRVRVVRESPRPMGPAVTVDITHACSLRCPFCIASSVLGRKEMPLATFKEVASAIRGVDRLTLIGGEPFMHTKFSEIGAIALDTAKEVEVFTNGLVLGAEPAFAGRRIAARFPAAKSERVTLVLSVDPAHGSQMKPGFLPLAVDGLLAAQKQGVCAARFSVTHPSLRTGLYLDTATIRDAIGEVSPRLADLFMECLMTGSVQDKFYFNSVICSSPGTIPEYSRVAEGEAAFLSDPGGSGELLRLEDLVFSPEVVITFDDAGAAHVRTSLASAWSRTPPGATCIGKLSSPETAVRLHNLPFESFRREFDPKLVAKWKASWDLAQSSFDFRGMNRLLRAHRSFMGIMTWDGGESFAREVSTRVIGFLSAGIGDRTLRWGGDEGGGSLQTEIFRNIAAHFSCQLTMSQRLAGWVDRLFFNEAGDRFLPVYTGEREILGMRTPLPPGEVHDILRVHVPYECGFSQKDELVVRPILLFHPDSTVEMLLPGISAAPATVHAFERLASPALRRLIEMIAAAGGSTLAHNVIKKLDPRLRQLTETWPPLPDPPTRRPSRDDLLTAFEECSFDRNRQRPDEDNPELLALLLLHAPERFPPSQVARFASRALTWLERSARTEGLSLSAYKLLAQVKLSGRTSRRLRTLLESVKPPEPGLTD